MKITHLRMPVVLLSLLLAVAVPVRSQTQAQKLQACQDALETSQEVIAVKNERIAKLEERIAARDEKIEAQKQQIDNLTALVNNLQRQIDTQAVNIKTLDNSMGLQANIITSQQAAIISRDTVITALVKANKRSTLDKVVESLPSIAGIIALALTAGR